MAETRLCPTCSTPFEVSAGSHRRYCSEPCRPKSPLARTKRPPVELECAFCGKTFERTAWIANKQVRLGQAQYCSTDCRDDAKRGRKGTRRVEWITKECPVCGEPFEVPPSRTHQKVCSYQCSGRIGGRPAGQRKESYLSNDGYVMVYVPPEKRPKSQPKKAHHGQHRVVMAEMLGRWPESYEQVHHINADKTDNRPENLQLRSGPHGKGGVLRCRACGSNDIEHVALGG